MLKTQPRKISMSDIAREANVSLTTVSMVLGKRKTPIVVSEERACEIRNIARKMGYKPNVFARGLASNRSSLHQLVIVVPNDNILDGRINTQVLVGLTEAANEKGFTCVLLSPQGEPGQAFVNHPLFKERLVEGVVALGWERMEEEYLAECLDVGLPIVGAHVESSPDKVPYVGPDDFTNGYMVARHLYGLGHRKIAFAGGYLDADAANERRRGVRAFLNEHNIDWNTELLIPGDYVKCDEVALGSILKSSDRPTAVIAAADRLAANIMIKIRKMGLSIPGDVSVAGFDDAEFAELLTPPLTTVRIDGLAEGRRVCQMILDIIQGDVPDKVAVRTPGVLVVRESTGALQK